MDVVAYKEFEIKASPHNLAESGDWSLNIYIVKQGTDHDFHRPASADFMEMAPKIISAYYFPHESHHIS